VILYHIVEQEKWLEASEGEGEDYEASSLVTEGFIHCSYSEQVIGTWNKVFDRRSGLWLLHINPALIEARIIDEDLYQMGEKFPHVYGPIPLRAVVKACPIEQFLN
tara:strand:- start:1102 stop:1419 length:318 start_codon:yes stop_codon:yes gene_type:complete